jgi:hypothetical protein
MVTATFSTFIPWAPLREAFWRAKRGPVTEAVARAGALLGSSCGGVRGLRAPNTLVRFSIWHSRARRVKNVDSDLISLLSVPHMSQVHLPCRAAARPAFRRGR